MSWVTPPVYTVGQVLTAALMNNISADFNWLSFLKNAVSGNISAAGTVVQGTGFSVVHTSTGNYTITTTATFPTAGLFVTPNIQSVIAGGGQQTGTTFGVAMTTPGSYTDAAFDFLIVGHF